MDIKKVKDDIKWQIEKKHKKLSEISDQQAIVLWGEINGLKLALEIMNLNIKEK